MRQERFGRGKSAGSHRRQRSSVRMEDPYQHGFEAMVQSYSSDSELLTHGSSPHLWLRFLQLLQEPMHYALDSLDGGVAQ